MKEEIIPVIIDGQEIPGYFVSNTGKVWSSLKTRGCPPVSYVSDQKRDLKLSSSKNKDGTVKYMFCSISYPKGLFDYDYAKPHRAKDARRRTMKVHQLVMNSFKPIETNPPDRLKDYWFDLPSEVKKWIAETVYINHIDHDPTNNNLWNLEYVTPRENTRKAIHHYEGKLSNKSMMNDKENKEENVTVLSFI
jgi:hypothetical protein